jgi:hypothetical protein
MKRAQAAHRFEAMWRGVLAAVVGSGMLMVTLMFETLAAVGWHEVLVTVPVDKPRSAHINY